VNRRDAVQRIALVLGAAVTPKVARAVEAGFTTPAPGLALRSLTRAQAELVATLCEHIIPATDTPGARAARVDAFIDALLADIFTAEERERFVASLADVDARARAAAGTTFLECATPQQVAILVGLERDAQSAGVGEAPFFPWLKELTLVGYYTSEVGATEELRYLHVAGRYDGDVPYEQVGRAYS
jgi:hypothetical protein